MRHAYFNLATGAVLAALAGALISIIGELPGRFTWAGIDARIPLGLLMLAGVALAAYGVWQRFAPPPPPSQQGRADAQLIFRSMIAIAGADREIHIDEIQMIQRCCSQFFKREMTYSDVRKAFDHHQRTNFAGFAFEGAEQTASLEARAWAYKAAIIVAKSDGDLSETEQAKLAALAKHIGLSPADQSAARAEAETLLATLKPATA